MNMHPSPDLLSPAKFGGPDAGPLHAQVRRFLREIIEIHFVDGQAFWTERLLMEKLGVARGTLRQALDDLTREGLLVREVKRGSFVRKKQIAAIGLIFKRANSSFCAEMIQHIGEECGARGLKFQLYPLISAASLSVLPSQIRHSPSEEKLLLMREGFGDLSSLWGTLIEKGYQVLSLDEPEDQSVPFVATDSQMAIRIALEHLVNLGHQRITFLVNESSERASVQNRISAFERMSLELKLSHSRIFRCDNHSGKSSFEKAYGALPQVWENQSSRPTAIFTASDPGAWAALRWFAEQDIKVPNQVSVLGFEGLTLDAFTYPPLSTVAHDLTGLVKSAIYSLTSGPTLSQPQWVTPQLVLRESTAPPL